MAREGDHAVFLVLVVLALLFVQRTPNNDAYQRRRSAAATPQPPAAAHQHRSPIGLLGSGFNWQTVSNLLRWRAEMNRLDTILDAVSSAGAVTANGR